MPFFCLLLLYIIWCEVAPIVNCKTMRPLDYTQGNCRSNLQLFSLHTGYLIRSYWRDLFIAHAMFNKRERVSEFINPFMKLKQLSLSRRSMKYYIDRLLDLCSIDCLKESDRVAVSRRMDNCLTLKNACLSFAREYSWRVTSQRNVNAHCHAIACVACFFLSPSDSLLYT